MYIQHESCIPGTCMCWRPQVLEPCILQVGEGADSLEALTPILGGKPLIAMNFQDMEVRSAARSHAPITEHPLLARFTRTQSYLVTKCCAIVVADVHCGRLSALADERPGANSFESQRATGF
jgi:hypothetical protein